MAKDQELEAAIGRLRKHAAALAGEKSAAAYSASPYFSRLPGDSWVWETDELNADRKRLIDAVIAGKLQEASS